MKMGFSPMRKFGSKRVYFVINIPRKTQPTRCAPFLVKFLINSKFFGQCFLLTVLQQIFIICILIQFCIFIICCFLLGPAGCWP